jgi:hypothetical protein
MNATQANPSHPHRKTTCTVAIYHHGTITDRGHLETLKWKSQATRKGGGIRSAITTFSSKSAANLRRLLAQVVGPKGWHCFGMTLTVPGPNIEPEEWRRLWHAYCQRLRRMGHFALIWRIEMQKRGQPHVHCICWSKDGPEQFRMAWLENLGLLGPYEGPKFTVGGRKQPEKGENGVPGPEQEIMRVCHRGLWPGASEHAVRIDEVGGEGNIGWWRYLAAHASKSKQSQLGWKGRQWGVINARHLDLEQPHLIELTRKAEVKVMRYLKRLIRCRFASAHGRQTWFVRTQTVRRLCTWATQISGA